MRNLLSRCGWRHLTALVVIVMFMGAFTIRAASGEKIEPWMVGVVSLLAVSAAVAALGRKNVRAAYDMIRRQ